MMHTIDVTRQPVLLRDDVAAEFIIAAYETAVLAIKGLDRGMEEDEAEETIEVKQREIVTNLRAWDPNIPVGLFQTIYNDEDNIPVVSSAYLVCTCDGWSTNVPSTCRICADLYVVRMIGLPLIGRNEIHGRWASQVDARPTALIVNAYEDADQNGIFDTAVDEIAKGREAARRRIRLMSRPR